MTDAYTPLPNSSDLDKAAEAAVIRAKEWLALTNNAASKKEAASTEQLAALVRDDDGIRFTMGFVDRVARPTDNKVAAHELSSLANPFKTAIPSFIGAVDKGLVSVGAVAAPIFPSLVMPLARKRLRQMVSHLVLDAEGKALNAKLTEAKEQGYQLNLNLLGEAVLGEAEAKSRLERTRQMLQNPLVTYASIKASSVCAQLNPWDIQGNIERLKDRLRPLYREAMKRSPHAFINMDMEEYKDLRLTIDLFKDLLSEDEFMPLEAGIVLQAYLPDTFDALVELAEFAKERRAKGGAKIKIRLVKGANLSMERVEAQLHDWAQAPYLSKEDVDANYYRLMDYIFQPEHADNVRIGIASHNLFTVALATKLVELRGVQHQLDVEMLQGMAPAQARAVHEVVGGLILYTPVVHAEDFDVAVSYLVRRLEENGEKHNFLHALFAHDPQPMEDQEQHFLNAVRDRWETFAGPRRTQNRTTDKGLQSGTVPGHFLGEPDTDPSLPQNRDWALALLKKDPGKVESPKVTDPAQVDKVVATAQKQSAAWAKLSGKERAEVLTSIATELANARGDLINVMTHESGKTVGESDPEISEAIDFAMYYAESARQLDVARSKFTPFKVVLVTPPWNFPVAIPMGGVFAALAAGAAVIIKPAPQVVRCAEVYKSAFGHAGQKCSAASLVILVGSVGKSERFINQLVDATRSLKVGKGTEIDTTMNGIIEAPGEKLMRGLTQLEPGEQWLVKPEKLNEEGTLWSPGIRDNVKPNSWYHTHECFGPVLGIMRADTLEEAIKLQNSTGFGLTGGIHSLDQDEIDYWRENVEVGNAYVNRGITGAIVERQSFGGWKDSAIGSGAKAGGPNYVAQQGMWADGDLSQVPSVSLDPAINRALRDILSTVELSDEDREWLQKAAHLDALAWREEFNVEHDRTALLCETNVFRYRPLLQPLQVRIGADFKLRDVLRLQLAALITESPVRFSANQDTAVALAKAGIKVDVVSDADFAAEIRKDSGVRIRTVGKVSDDLYPAAAESSSVVLDQPVLADGRRELLPFLLEQAVATTQHRFGVIGKKI